MSKQNWMYFETALLLAVQKHAGQTRWDGTPYILHPLRITYKCSHLDDPLLMCVAILHDTVEDTDLELDDLEGVMPGVVICALDAITHRQDESYTTYLGHVKDSELATTVKLYDLQDNMNILTDPKFNHPDRFEKNAQRLRKYWEAYMLLSKSAITDQPLQ